MIRAWSVHKRILVSSIQFQALFFVIFALKSQVRESLKSNISIKPKAYVNHIYGRLCLSHKQPPAEKLPVVCKYFKFQKNDWDSRLSQQKLRDLIKTEESNMNIWFLVECQP